MVLGWQETKGSLAQPLQGDTPSPTRGALRLCQTGDQKTPTWTAHAVSREAGKAPGLSTGRRRGISEEKMLIPSNKHKHPIHQAQVGEPQRTKSVHCVHGVSKHIRVLWLIWKILKTDISFSLDKIPVQVLFYWRNNSETASGI